MDSSDGPAVVWGVVMVTLLIGSVAARRLPFQQIVRNLLVWLCIFGAVYGIFLFKDELAPVWSRIAADLGGGNPQLVSGQDTVLQRVDGHFFVDGSIDGHPVRFLVDSGATVTTISPETARAAGIVVERFGFPIVVETANGLANSWPATASEVELGSVRYRDLGVHVSEVAGSTNLLGMNALSQLSSWEVRGERMILRP